MRRRRALRSLLVATPLALCTLTAAGAQSPPPPRTPPTQPQPTTQPRSTAQAQPEGQLTEASRAALLAVGREAAALIALGAFADPTRLEPAVAGLVDRDASRSASVSELERAEADGTAALTPLLRVAPNASPEVRAVLALLSPEDRAAAGEGRTISIESERYLRALDHLARFGGTGPASPSPPDQDAIARALGEPSTTAVIDDDDGGGSVMPVVLAGVALLVIASVALAVLRRRGAMRPSAATYTNPPPVTREPLIARPSAASMHDLLDVSRRLTAAASGGNVDRLVVRHALDLVRGDGAALVRVDDTGTLRLAAESHVDLLVADELADSGIARVAETGTTLVQVSASDRAIRNVPAALAAVPLVGGGRVLGVLVVVRRVSEPFGADERNVLEALAPVAAAAMHTATQSQAVIETSLGDALTGTGNRRRFDLDLARTLADAQGPTSLIIVDLDHFKSVNDTYGHQGGDTVLQTVGAALKHHVRPDDTVYRFGGEEFCVLLPSTDTAEAAEVAERLRAAIEQTSFAVSPTESIGRTASFGVATTSGTDAGDLIGRADRALYDAKSGGRNAVRVDTATIS